MSDTKFHVADIKFPVRHEIWCRGHQISCPTSNFMSRTSNFLSATGNFMSDMKFGKVGVESEIYKAKYFNIGHQISCRISNYMSDIKFHVRHQISCRGQEISCRTWNLMSGKVRSRTSNPIAIFKIEKVKVKYSRIRIVPPLRWRQQVKKLLARRPRLLTATVTVSTTPTSQEEDDIRNLGSVTVSESSEISPPVVRCGKDFTSRFWEPLTKFGAVPFGFLDHYGQVCPQNISKRTNEQRPNDGWECHSFLYSFPFLFPIPNNLLDCIT